MTDVIFKESILSEGQTWPQQTEPFFILFWLINGKDCSLGQSAFHFKSNCLAELKWLLIHYPIGFQRKSNCTLDVVWSRCNWGLLGLPLSTFLYHFTVLWRQGSEHMHISLCSSFFVLCRELARYCTVVRNGISSDNSLPGFWCIWTAHFQICWQSWDGHFGFQFIKTLCN